MAARTLCAKNVMRRRVISVSPELTLREVAKRFIDRRITGAPVVSKDGRLLGVISQTDLVRHQRDGSPRQAGTPGHYALADEDLVLRPGFHVELPDDTRVREVMTPATATTAETTPIDAIARFMLKRRIHRVIVTRGEKLAGIVTSMDLLRALLRQVGPRRTVARRQQQRVRR